MKTCNGCQKRKILLCPDGVVVILYQEGLTGPKPYVKTLTPLGTKPIFLHFLLARRICVEPVHEMHIHLPAYTSLQ